MLQKQYMPPKAKISAVLKTKDKRAPPDGKTIKKAPPGSNPRKSSHRTAPLDTIKNAAEGKIPVLRHFPTKLSYLIILFFK